MPGRPPRRVFVGLWINSKREDHRCDRSTSFRYELSFSFSTSRLSQTSPQILKQIFLAWLRDVHRLSCACFPCQPLTQLFRQCRHASAFALDRHPVLCPALRDRSGLSEELRDRRPAGERVRFRRGLRLLCTQQLGRVHGSQLCHAESSSARFADM